MRYETKLEAVRAWVEGFNAIPIDFVQKAYEGNGGFFFDEVEVLAEPQKECHECEAQVDIDENVCTECGGHDFGNTLELPMWGTVWTFGERIDDEWARENAETLSSCGFHVYDSEDLGVFIGINGAGYDFYEAHWTPLYEARGLRWHKEEEGA